jgi:hypothetical protein
MAIPDGCTLIIRSEADVRRRIENAIRELDRLDAGQGPSVPGHSIRDAAHGLRVLREEMAGYEIDEIGHEPGVEQ